MQRFLSLITKKQSTVVSAATILMSMVLLSRILGLLRDRLLSARFTPDDLGIYFAAFRLPNFLFELLVMGALSSALVPVFTRYVAINKKEELEKVVSTLINIGIMVIVVLMIPFLIWTHEVSRLLAPGFSESQLSEMVVYSRALLVLQVIPLLVGSILTSVLQSHTLFLVPSLAPVVYNVGIIIGVVFFSSSSGLWAPIIGVSFGALLFCAIHFPVMLALGFKHRWTIDTKNSGVREIGSLMAPRSVGLAISQIDTTVDLMLATLLGARMVTIFNFAQHLQQLPIGLFGATIAQAAFPGLSHASALEDKEKFKKLLISSIHQMLFFVLPISVLFIVLRIPIVRLVFGAGLFDWQATVLTGMTLSLFSISLFAQTLVQVVTRAFYALFDTKTPVTIGILVILVNTLLSLLFVQVFHMPIWSLGLSTSIASVFHLALLLVLLDRKLGGLMPFELVYPPLKMFMAAFSMGIMLYIPLKLLDQLVFDTTRTVGLVFLTGISGTVGMITYLFLSWVFNVGQVQAFFTSLKRITRRVPFIFEPSDEVVQGTGNEI